MCVPQWQLICCFDGPWWIFQKRVTTAPMMYSCTQQCSWQDSGFLWIQYFWSSLDWKWTVGKFDNLAMLMIDFNVQATHTSVKPRWDHSNRNMFATTCLSALLDHQLWILMWWRTLVHTASWCTWSVNRIHGQSYLNEACKIFCRLWQAACKWIGLQAQAISLMTSRLRTTAVMAWLQFMYESSLHSH